MNRRELLKMITTATGAALVGGNALLAGCTRVGRQNAVAPRFSPEDVSLLDEVAETILPRTDTPGAKEAQVGRFITVMVSDCYNDQERALFHRGLPEIDAVSRRVHGSDFLALTPEQRHQLVVALDREAREYNLYHADPHYFTLIKQLTLLGFFTSETAAREVFRYIAIPGRYDGCAPYEEGDRAWATR